MDKIEKALDYKKALIDVKNQELESATKKQDKAITDLKTVEDSIAIIQTLSVTLQNGVKDKITSIVQHAMDSLFPKYTFCMDYVARRDKTEVDIYIMDQEGHKEDILSSNGGGLADIISFTLRVAIWSLDRGASNVLILDEPMKFLSDGYKDAGAKLLRVLSEQLGIQLIIVSHVNAIKENGTKSYNIVKDKNDVSHAYELK